MIYFLKITDQPFIKIGYTKNKSYRRIEVYNTYSPFNHELLLFIEGSMEDEKSLHSKFSEYKINNREWFHYNQAVQEYIQDKLIENIDVSRRKGRQPKYSDLQKLRVIEMYNNSIHINDIANYLSTTQKAARKVVESLKLKRPKLKK